MNHVPNLHPTQSSPYKIALIGEAPGKDEDFHKIPFCGVSGRFLSSLLHKAGTTREACFLGNVSQVRPADNKIDLLRWNGDEIQHGLECLRSDIEKADPNIVVLLGNVALKAARDLHRSHPLKPNAYRFKNSVWRGSLFVCTEKGSPFEGRKCIASYHPAYVLRDYSCLPLLMFDLKRAVSESTTKDLRLPSRSFEIPLTADRIIELLSAYRHARKLTASDIEGYWDAMSCISFSNDPASGFVIPFTKRDGQYIWSRADGCRIWRALAEFLEDPLVPKVWQNGLYDRFALQYGHSIVVQGTVDDTMLSGWEVYSELPKSLATQASIWTREPYYKGDRKSQDDTTFYMYGGRDSAVTLEICHAQKKVLSGSSLEHYQMNVEMQNPLLYMELKGIRYNEEEAARRRSLLRTKLFEAQAKLNGLTDSGLRFTSIAALRQQAAELMCYKKDQSQPKKDFVEDFARFNALLNEPNPNLATLGELESLLGVGLNVDSAKQFPSYLYDTLNLPVQFNENDEGEKVRTADYEALIKLSKLTLDNPAVNQVIQIALEIRALSTRETMLSIHADDDKRIRCGYNVVGSETGRVTCYTSPTGSGYNLQTIPNYTDKTLAPGGVIGDRDLFMADEGYWFFQCDLKGADGWTVACYSAMLGDRTMLDDYLYGLKPANILCLMLRAVKGDYSNRAWLKAESKTIDKDSWDYFAMKRVQHGVSYMEGPITVARNILKDSEGKYAPSVAECKDFKEVFMRRYPGIRLWHDWISRRIHASNGIPTFPAASGQVRKFFGRPTEIATSIVAHEPQANTTYATNMAMLNLWRDPANRFMVGGKTSLKIQPLHQVHDALCGQFRKEDTEWAITKIKSYFDNPIKIAGQTVVIPFDGAYGESWGNLKEGVI